MLGFITKLFGGTKSEKDIKEINPIIDEVNKFNAEFESLTEDEIKNKTNEFIETIAKNKQALEDEKEFILNKLRTEKLSADETADLSERLKSLEKDIFANVQDTLNEILPQAFAVVKQACKRLADEGFSYEYAGTQSQWNMIPFDVQLIGGVVLHQGRISEMATGEGKTLVAILPIYLNALAKKGVHLVTVNDYLAKRDCDWMRPVYEYLGLTCDAIQSNMSPEVRKRIYNSDITYGTNNEFGFDYLRDNMVTDPEDMVQREHWYAIVDEVDSVLIDEARTPLIISGPVGQSDQKFEEMNPRVRRLVEAQGKYVTSMLAEAEKLLTQYSTDQKRETRFEAGKLIFRAYKGLPKHKKLAKLLQEPENLKLRQEMEIEFLKERGARMPEIIEELFYTVDEKNHQIDITEKGRTLLSTAQEDVSMFIIPDIAAELSALENEVLTPDEKQLKKDQIYLLFAERSDRIHTVNQLLRAYSLYEMDQEYVIQDGKVMIVDEFTGRILEGRRYSDGLHQAIEAKENVKVERDTQTFATITLQNYFRLYHKLAGMTGTAETEAGEFDKIYKLDCVVIPTNRPIVRDDMDDLVYKTKREKYNAILEQTRIYLQEGRPVLVGTASVDVSEVLSKMFTRAGVKHNVLNAKQHAREAEIVATAGCTGAVTIATNMAGRGTDIKLDHETKAAGGLAIIGTERHEARRIDRQLRGRSGRQGDPGSSQFFISLEDNLMRLFQSDRIAGVMTKLNIPDGEPIQHSLITKSVENAQKKVEENNFGIRKRLIEYDDVMNQQRTVIYNRRKSALRGERLRGELMEYIIDMATEWYETMQPNNEYDQFMNAARATLLCEPDITATDFKSIKQDEFVKKVLKSAEEFYDRKEEMLGSEFMSRLEQVAVLQTIDDKWREHLRSMDDLKEGIHLRSYAQKDPLLEYKQEAFSLFVDLIEDINKNSVQFAFRYFPQMTAQDAHQRSARNAPAVRRTNVSGGNFHYEHSATSVPSFVTTGSAPRAQQAEGTEPGGVSVRTERRDQPKIGRNDPCPCGSGKKYKNCHGKAVAVES
ncbi:MAG: preprotein translocase subunit SecA [Ignavibacteria bacterium]|jgi:preprotein translocase subunit SecA|nr:preprotein translocase subunit SecA [Ignavibacteria bacterium]